MKYLWIFLIASNIYASQKVKFIFKDRYNSIPAQRISFILTNENAEDYHYSISKYSTESNNHLKPNERILEPGFYTIIYNVSYHDYTCKFKEKIFITPHSRKIIIRIPAIRLRTSKIKADQNSFEKYQNYYYYNKICNGTYTDYYTNGHKRIEGNFVNGKAVSVTEYDKYSLAKKHSLYNRFAQPKEIITYDKNGNLIQKKLYTYGKRYIVLKIYDAKGKLLKRTKYNKY